MSAPQLTVYISGQGNVSADGLNTFSQNCDNVAQLRAFVGTVGNQVFVRGTVAIGDGGQGTFVWVPNVTGTDDNKNVIVPTQAATGYWARLTADSSTTDVIPCLETGVNVLALTPINGVPQPFAYANYQQFSFVAASNSTGTVTAFVAGGATLGVFNPDNTPSGSGAISAGRFYMIVFNQALAAGAGGFNLVFGAVAAGVTTIADATNGGLAFSANSGNITANIAPSDLVAKTALVGADLFVVGDSAAAFAAKKTTRDQVFTGKPIQIVNFETGAVATGTTVIPFDDTIPQQTEGDQYMSLAITPTNAASTLIIDVVAFLSVSTNVNVTTALFQDATAAALAAMVTYPGVTTGSGYPTVFRHKMLAGTTAATTFKVRAGGTASTTTFNGATGARLMGGVMASSITVTEIAP